MYILTRTRIANTTDPLAARNLAGQMAIAATKIVGQPVTAFENRFGESGAIIWSTRVDDMAQWDDLTAKLSADPTYQKLASHARPLFSLPTDRLTEILGSSVTSTTVSNLYASTSAVAAPGKIAAAVAHGIKIQEYVAKAGFVGMFGVSAFGAYGEVGWLLPADSAAELDRFHAFRGSDAGFIKLVDDGASLFLPGSGRNLLVSRL